MTLTIDFQPEMEQGLLAEASAKGISLTAFPFEMLTRGITIPTRWPANGN